MRNLFEDNMVGLSNELSFPCVRSVQGSGVSIYVTLYFFTASGRFLEVISKRESSPVSVGISVGFSVGFCVVIYL